jgi:hypothetical protein
MLGRFRSAGMSALVLAGVVVGSADLRAMPIQNLGPAGTEGLSTETVAMVCGPYRCWRRPGFGYGYGWGRPAYGWGWRRPYSNAYSWARHRDRPGRPIGSNH